MRRLSTTLLLIVLVSVPLAVCAQVYTWTDAHGTVHYSDSPPPRGTHYKDIKIAGATAISEPQATGKSGAQANANADSDHNAPPVPTSGRMKNTPANRKKLCDNLTANLALLKQDNPIVVKGKNGKERVLSKDRKAQELAKTKKQYQAYCQSTGSRAAS